MENTLIIALLVGLSTLVIFSIFRKTSTENEFKNEEITSKILLGLTQEQGKNLTEIINQINRGGTIQNQLTSENFQKMEKRFGELQLGINVKLNEELEKMQEALLKRVNESLQNLQKINTENFSLLSKSNKERLDQIQEGVEKRLDENLRKNLESFAEVTKNLGQMQTTAQRMIDSTKSVDKLNTIFERTSSKAFGDFGEKYLETLLSESLANGSWDKQVTVPGTNDKIDFVINIEDKKIGIDSKFPVTKYRDYIDAPSESKVTAFKDFLTSVKLMAKSISEKYDKTNFLDVLLVYLPSDSMYIDVVNNEEISNYLAKIKVTPISPNTIFPMIKTLGVYQFKSQVSENAERIISGLQVVRKNIDSFQAEFRKLGDKLRHAQDNYDKADRSLTGVQKEVFKLEELETRDSLETETIL